MEFGIRGIPLSQQPQYDVLYKGRKVGHFIPDLVAWDAIVVDAKVIDRITDVERVQMLNYLKNTKLGVGVLLNYKHPKIEWELIVL